MWPKVSGGGCRELIADGESGTRRHLESAVFLHADATEPERLRGHVPLPSNIAGVAVHPEDRVFPGYTGWKDYRRRPKVDPYPQWDRDEQMLASDEERSAALKKYFEIVF